jgi:hypothetical protein
VSKISQEEWPGHVVACSVQLNTVALLNQIGKSISWKTGIIALRLLPFVHVVPNDASVASSIADVV